MQDWKVIKLKVQLRRQYRLLLPSLREIARKHGYALGLHGSMERDLDLIAVPWVKHPNMPETLVLDIQRLLVKKPYWQTRNYWRKEGRRPTKPQGRLAYAIPFAHLHPKFENPNLRHAYIDLSVIPPKRRYKPLADY